MLFFCFVRTNFLFFRSDRQRTLARKFYNLDSGQTKRRTKSQDHCLQFGAIFSLVSPIINLCEAPAIAGIFAAWVAELTFAAGLAEGRDMKKHEETYMQTADHCKLVREMMRNAHSKYWCFMHSMPICYCCRFTDMCRTECHSWDTVKIAVCTKQEALARVLIFHLFFILWHSFLHGFGSESLAGWSILPRHSEDHLWRCQTPRCEREKFFVCFCESLYPTISTRTQGFLQTILFSVLASFSLSAVLHAAEVIVAGCLLLASIHNFVLPRQKSETCSHGFGPSKTGATGIATPLRRLTLPRLLESDRRRAHRSAAPVLS